jgi:hypothetical protein
MLVTHPGDCPPWSSKKGIDMKTEPERTFNFEFDGKKYVALVFKHTDHDAIAYTTEYGPEDEKDWGLSARVRTLDFAADQHQVIAALHGYPNGESFIQTIEDETLSVDIVSFRCRYWAHFKTIERELFLSVEIRPGDLTHIDECHTVRQAFEAGFERGKGAGRSALEREIKAVGKIVAPALFGNVA